MAERILIEVLNMSLTASVVIAAVLVFRLVLRRAPRIFSYVLWAAVLFRLLCPFSFSSHLSLLGLVQSEPASQGRMEYIPEDIGYQTEPEVSLPVPAVNEMVNGSLPPGNPAGSVNPLQIALYAGARIWILGMLCMAAYSMFSWVKLKKRLKNAVLERDNIYRLPGEGTPFVCGIFRPAVYFPGTYEGEEKEYLLLHEQIHIRRGDLIFRMLAWLALCLHWFNPFVWLAFSLSGRDMEMSCDEAVIRRLGNQVKKEYSRSLLAIASGQKIGRGIPIAFGEGDTGGRIKNILRYRKPAAFLAGSAAVLCVVLAGFFLANPQGRDENSNVFYGVVQYEDAEGAELPLVVCIPRMGEVVIPEAEEIGPYIETDFDGLEAGDLVRITFPSKEEISVMETSPARFSRKAESIEVMGRGPFWIRSNGPGRYLFTVPLGMAFDAAEGDLLEIYHQSSETDGQEKELLAAVKVQSVNQDAYQILVELSTEELETFLAEFGFGVECRLAKAEGNSRNPAILEESGDTANPAGDAEDVWENGNFGAIGELAASDFSQGEVRDGVYRLEVRGVARSARGIDRYMLTDDQEGELPFLAFDDSCAFLLNDKMDSVHFVESSFEEFADAAEEAASYPVSLLTFQEGRIVRAALMSAWYAYGISYAPFVRDGWYESMLEFPEMEGIDPLESYYTLARTEEGDFGDGDGEETLEIYTGNIGDGDSGLVLFRGADGQILYSEGAHTARAGWKNIYQGTLDGVDFLMTLRIDDREDYGSYTYQVFRLGAAGEIRQMAGSTFAFDRDEIPYDRNVFLEWTDGLTTYLDECHLLLSTQAGEVRTEPERGSVRYNFETLNKDF